MKLKTNQKRKRVKQRTDYLRISKLLERLTKKRGDTNYQYQKLSRGFTYRHCRHQREYYKQTYTQKLGNLFKFDNLHTIYQFLGNYKLPKLT